MLILIEHRLSVFESVINMINNCMRTLDNDLFAIHIITTVVSYYFSHFL